MFVLPRAGAGAVTVRRRVDLIFAPPEVYWTAVVGWCVFLLLFMHVADVAKRSGSIMFQRDLRQWAKDRCGMKFDSSGMCVPLLLCAHFDFRLTRPALERTRRYDSKEFHPRTEKEAFELLGLEWVDPVWRNADL